MIELPALSYHQPWASLITTPIEENINYGIPIKDYENRNRRIVTHLNRITLVHATGNINDFEFDKAKRIYFRVTHGKDLPDIENYSYGGIIGWAVYDKCIVVKNENKNISKWLEGDFGWHIIESGPTDFIPCNGSRNWFKIEVPDTFIPEEILEKYRID
ncbi:MAG: hypothetical protein PVH88_01905 [Ignavibacteria bacterium]|jgi:hypothetical protein